MQKCQWLGVESDMVVWLHSLFGFEYRNNRGDGRNLASSTLVLANSPARVWSCKLIVIQHIVTAVLSAAAILLPESFFHLCMASD